MNAHDSERIAGALEGMGLSAVAERDEADLVVFNTCTIREKPDERLYSQLEHMKHLKRRHPDRIIAVGGCLVEAQKGLLQERFPWVDVAFGPGRIDAFAGWIAERSGRGVAVGAAPTDPVGFYGTGDERTFASELPVRRERAAQAWIQISMGCNMACSYCIVPTVRGRERSRDPKLIVEEVAKLAADGVREVTLLGQNVNSYGKDIPGERRPLFARLLTDLGTVDGIERIRFTSPHPAHMNDEFIEAMATTDAVCPQLHLPLQSGSSRILKAMRRTYSRERYLDLVGRLRSAIPDIALTTDIIVGFPGETEDDFADTMSVVDEVGFDGAYTFIFSPRTGTEAAELEDLPHEIKQERVARLVELVRSRAAERNARHLKTIQPVLVEGPARRGEGMLKGRIPHGVTVNFHGEANAGDFVEVAIQDATSETLRGAMVVGSAR